MSTVERPPSGSRIGRRQFLAGSIALAGSTLLPMARTLAVPGKDELRIQRLAWAGIRLQLPQSTLFIDPLIDQKVWGAALADTLVPVRDPVGDTYVLVTHAHGDHYDAQAVADALAHGGALVHPAGTNALPAPAGARVRPVALWEPQLLGEFTVTPVPASDGYGDPQVSWVVSAGGRRIFHGGDTQWHGHWWRIGQQFGPFDAAFLPINGARFGFREPVSGQPGVLTPEQAVAAATILGARRVIPIHYGISGMEKYVEVEDPIGQLRKAAREKSIDLQPLAPGAWVDWTR